MRSLHVELLLYGCALFGSVLLGAVGRFYRIDQVYCANWPSLHMGLLCAAIYLTALTCLAVSWLGLARLCVRPPPSNSPSLRRIFLAGALVHVVSLSVPPFLSYDALAYAAIGRVQALYGMGMYAPLASVLPPDDTARQAIASANAAWLSAGSVYGPGWNRLAAALAGLAGNDLTLCLRLFQGVGLVAVLLTAWFAGQAVLGAQQARRAAVWVLFCPLTIIEGTNNAHNDTLLALSVALFVHAIVWAREVRALWTLCLGLFIKASALILLGFHLVHLLATHAPLSLRRNFAKRPKLGMSAVLVLGALLLWLLRPWLMRYAQTVVSLLGSPADAMPYCVRSVECLPRVLLHLILGLPTASWLVGLGFRVMAGALLLGLALRAPRGVKQLSSAASLLFFYYLYLHSAGHAWYLLPLLPLLSFAHPALRPAMLALPLSSLAHYAIELPFACDYTPFVVGASQVLQAAVVIVPPTLLLLPAFRRTLMGVV